jgi:hypothetical protein
VSQQADSAIRRDIDGGSVRSMDQYWEGNDLRTGIDLSGLRATRT